ncbi:hypothetical protein MG293_018869 [Ovis ammon polii]|uniref:Mucin like 3 n=1 Tax=Ovis ammon polii TaxID=230172 RepID=A0AAD4Y2I3_OVIAM|nr:hypothetical protein MG293_018869 [Ovis ammon polii]
MAQPAHCIRSVFGLQCFFLFLLTSQEAGAAALQELQKTGKSTSDHLFSLAPAPVSITPSNHAALHSEHSSPDPLISTETHKPKHQCTTTHRSKLAHQSSTTQAAPPAAEQNPSKQGRGPIIRNERASEPKDTANTDQGSIVSEAPDNKSHPQQNKDDSQGGVPEGETEGTDSFPAWAIVVVILLSVILLLVFIGLIVLASYLARTRRALIQNTENNDSENAGGSNSYPVYLMEQQTLGPSQTPGPR